MKLNALESNFQQILVSMLRLWTLKKVIQEYIKDVSSPPFFMTTFNRMNLIFIDFKRNSVGQKMPPKILKKIVFIKGYKN